VTVVVAARAVEGRSALTDEDVALKEVPVDTVPEGAASTLAQATGKITLVDLYPGEILLVQRLVDPNVISGDGRMALVLADEEVLMALPADDLLSRVGVLKPGDHVDLLFSLDFPTGRTSVSSGEGEGAIGQGTTTQGDDEQATFTLLQNVVVAAIVGGLPPAGGESKLPSALLLTVTPQDALLVKYARDAGGILDLVLRAPGAEGPYESDPVDVDYMIFRYRIPTQVGR